MQQETINPGGFEAGTEHPTSAQVQETFIAQEQKLKMARWLNPDEELELENGAQQFFQDAYQDVGRLFPDISQVDRYLLILGVEPTPTIRNDWMRVALSWAEWSVLDARNPSLKLFLSGNDSRFPDHQSRTQRSTRYILMAMKQTKRGQVATLAYKEYGFPLPLPALDHQNRVFFENLSVPSELSELKKELIASLEIFDAKTLFILGIDAMTENRLEEFAKGLSDAQWQALASMILSPMGYSEREQFLLFKSLLRFSPPDAVVEIMTRKIAKWETHFNVVDLSDGFYVAVLASEDIQNEDIQNFVEQFEQLRASNPEAYKKLIRFILTDYRREQLELQIDIELRTDDEGVRYIEIGRRDID